MPSALMTLDTGRPSFSGRETTEQKVEALNNYVYMLLENLRYLLRNLGPENLNSEEMEQWLEEHVPTPVIEADSVYTDELYASYGEVADLVVDRLRTDYIRAGNFLNGDTGDINYIYIHDEVIEYRTAHYEGGGYTQLSWGGRTFYWTDETKTRMTSLTATDWPVYVYRYTELVKAKFAFQAITEDGTVTWYPVLRLGAGDGSGNNVAAITKHKNGLDIILTAANGQPVGIKASAVTGKLTLLGYEGTGYWFGTSDAYSALPETDDNTIYFITD